MLKQFLAEVPRAVCYPASPPSSRWTESQVAPRQTLQLAHGDWREGRKIDYTQMHHIPKAIVPFQLAIYRSVVNKPRKMEIDARLYVERARQ